MHDELARGKRDAPSGAVAPFPYGEAYELEAIELTADEVQFGVSELSSWRGA